MIPNPNSARLRPFRPSPFGRYTLLTPLSVGGMGEIFLARLEGPGGFQKLCVIKKILPALAQDPEFVERFVNEARTLVKLSHGAIAQVLDMGLHEGDPYLALEFVDGKDLRKVSARARERGEPLPPGFALYVMGRLLDALAYAHRKRDEDDRELGLVHRDVSPQNVLISYEGEVKIIDFGLAKSSLNSARTNPSMILGKFLYMSPEQARHQKVDRRADLYAAGLCLYELVAGRHPFEDVPSHALITAVANPDVVPLREAVPDCPVEIHDLVMRALEVEPAKRFQTAEEFRAKVGAALLQLDPEAGPESTSRHMRALFGAEFAQERKLLIGLRSAQPPEGLVESEPAVVVVKAPETLPREGERDTAVVPLEQLARDAEAALALQSGASLKLTPKLGPQPVQGPILAAPLSFAPTPRTTPPPTFAPEQDGDRETVPGVVLGTPLPEGEPTPLGADMPLPTSELPVLDPSALQFDPDEELAAARRDGTMPRVVIADLPRIEDTQPQVIVGSLLEEAQPADTRPPVRKRTGLRVLLGASTVLLLAATAGAFWVTQQGGRAGDTPGATQPPPQPVTQSPALPSPPPDVRAPFATLPAVPELPAMPEPEPVPANAIGDEDELLGELLAAAGTPEGEEGEGAGVLALLEVSPASASPKRKGQKKLTAREVQREWSQLQAVMGRVERRYGCDHEKLEALCSKRDWLRADLRKVKRASQSELASMRSQMRELRMKAARVEKGR